MKTVLGLDLGTQSLKLVFYDYENHCNAAVVSSPLEVERDKSGKAEQHAEWWLSAMMDCFSQVSTEIKSSVQAVAVSGQQHGFVALDAVGSVIAPVKLWCDTATQAEVEQLTKNCGGKEQAIALTGNPVLTGYTAAKILWLKNHRPDAYKRLSHILLPHDYINYILSGEFSMEYGDASGTGLLDVRKREWSTDMLKAVDSERDLAACLPPIFAENEFVGVVSAKASAAYGLPEGIPLASGGGDNMMGAIGTGNVKPGKLTISLGSSGTLYAYADKPVIDTKGNIAAFCSSSGGWLPLLCTMNCTLATEAIREAFNIGLDLFDELAASVSAGSDGLITLPFFNGERTPNLPQAKANIFGLDTHNCTRAHFLRSTIEAVCFSLKFGLDELKHLGIEAEEITLTGGGSKSAVWRQIIADLFQLPVRVLQSEEGASMGAALQALWVLQQQENPEHSLTAICEEHIAEDYTKAARPDPATAGIYEGTYKEYQHYLKQIYGV